MNHAEQCLKLERCLKLDPLSVVASTIEPSTVVSCPKIDFWQRLVHLLTHAQTLHVWQHLDRFGNRYWQAYDAATGRSTSAGSEAEIRAWLEERRYQK
ncbi:MAG: hypothetical protein KME42_25360 [Tildeniella nuda ZEHNDER 1965/U140]|nr:hypothetical protein [Tildeniella nuda ZEHNDER 1965/U140]